VPNPFYVDANSAIDVMMSGPIVVPRWPAKIRPQSVSSPVLVCRVLVCRVLVCRVLVCRVLVCRVLVCRVLAFRIALANVAVLQTAARILNWRKAF
jgi:hypothetical protein